MQCKSIEEVRSNIDRIDNEIIKLIAERTGYVAQASAFKKNEEGVKAPNRVEAVIQNVRNKAEEYGADPDMVEALYREMISRFINMEMDELKQRVGREKQIPFESNADPFYSAENIAELERRFESIKNGTSTLKEHELIEVEDE